MLETDLKRIRKSEENMKTEKDAEIKILRQKLKTSTESENKIKAEKDKEIEGV